MSLNLCCCRKICWRCTSSALQSLARLSCRETLLRMDQTHGKNSVTTQAYIRQPTKTISLPRTGANLCWQWGPTEFEPPRSGDVGDMCIAVNTKMCPLDRPLWPPAPSSHLRTLRGPGTDPAEYCGLRYRISTISCTVSSLHSPSDLTTEMGIPIIRTYL